MGLIWSTRRWLEFGSTKQSPSPRAHELPKAQQTLRISKLLLEKKKIPRRFSQSASHLSWKQEVNFCLWPLEDSLCLGEAKTGAPATWQPARRALGAARGCGGLAATITLTVTFTGTAHMQMVSAHLLAGRRWVKIAIHRPEKAPSAFPRADLSAETDAAAPWIWMWFRTHRSAPAVLSKPS